MTKVWNKPKKRETTISAKKLAAQVKRAEMTQKEKSVRRAQLREQTGIHNQHHFGQEFINLSPEVKK